MELRGSCVGVKVYTIQIAGMLTAKSVELALSISFTLTYEAAHDLSLMGVYQFHSRGGIRCHLVV